MPAVVEIDLEGVEPRILFSLGVVAINLEGLDPHRTGGRGPSLAAVDSGLWGCVEALGHRKSLQKRPSRNLIG